MNALWNRLTPTDRIALALGALVAAAQLVVLVQLCHESVRKGERLRAAQAAQSAQPAVQPRPAWLAQR